MSGIAGIYNSNGAPIERDLLKKMAESLAHRGPDGSSFWAAGNVGLAHLMLHTTPESIHERQPLCDESGSLWLVLDGRVDDREGLRSALQSHGATLRDDTDAELVLKAYEVWGEQCPAHIVGDFAFAIWDSRRRQLFCARDFLGVKPFYYYHDTDTFVFASELHALFCAPNVTDAINEGMVGEYLANRITNREESLYRDIRRLMPGHSMVVDSGARRSSKYWEIDPGRAICYKNDDEYAEHFLAVTSEAIRCRLRSVGRTGAYLSGGLDSSTIVVLAKSLLENGRVPDCGFETFSNVFPDAPEADESGYIQDIVERCGFVSNAVLPKMPDEREHARTAGKYADIPDYPTGSLGTCLRSVASQKGFRVLLAGYGGDEWLCTSRDYYADLVKKPAFGEFLTHFRREEESSVLSRRFAQVLINHGLKPLLPGRTREFLRDLKHGFPSQWPWINSDFARRISLRDRLRAEVPPPVGLSLTKQATYFSFKVGGAVQSLELEDRASSAVGIEQRYPFDDRRFVEFGFALPDRQRWRFGHKFVLRHAMNGMLPESIRTRRDKGNFSRFHPEALKQANARGRFASLQVADKGWVDGTRAVKMLADMEALYETGDSAYVLPMGPLWMVYSIELWLRNCQQALPDICKRAPTQQLRRISG
jgi:asparagine synthase (glutamine-hydrolysing)